MHKLARLFKKTPDGEAFYIEHEAVNPEDFPLVYYTKGGIRIQHDHNGITMQEPDGSERILSSNGNRGKIYTVSSVTIADIAYVTAHHVNRVHETVSHVVHFCSGGTFCYSTDLQGQLLDFEYDRLDVSWNEGGHLVVGCTDLAHRLRPTSDN